MLRNHCPQFELLSIKRFLFSPLDMLPAGASPLTPPLPSDGREQARQPPLTRCDVYTLATRDIILLRTQQDQFSPQSSRKVGSRGVSEAASHNNAQYQDEKSLAAASGAASLRRSTTRRNASPDTLMALKITRKQ